MLRERRGFSNYPVAQVESERKTKGEMGEEITIKFVGDMDENIEDIAGSVKCSEAARNEIRSILKIYANKIARLREERNFYKELLLLREDADLEENARLKLAVQSLQEQLALKTKNNCERCTCFDESVFQSSKFTEDQYGLNRLSRASVKSYSNNMHSRSQQLQKREEELLIGSSKSSECRKEDSLQVSESVRAGEGEALNASISEEELAKLMMKYNISADELQQIFEEYDRENRQAYELFDSERQRELYRLGQRMQKDLWNRKIIKDIKKLGA